MKKLASGTILFFTGKILLFAMVLLCTGYFSGTLLAQTVNLEGVITSKPWQDKYYYIEINRIKYMFMPTIQVDAKFTGYQEQQVTPALLRYFSVGDKVLIAKEGFRIYRVQFFFK